MTRLNAPGLRFALRGLFALAACLLLCGCKGKWEEYEKVLGYRGKARLNPFLAAERLLEELGHDVKSVKTLPKLPGHDAVLLVSGEGGLPDGRARQLLSWAYSGGHLIYCLGGTQPYNDFDNDFGAFLSALLLEEQKDPLLERLGVAVEQRKLDKKTKDSEKKDEEKDKKSKDEKPELIVKKDAPEKDKKKDAEDDAGKDDDKKGDEKFGVVERITWNGKKYELGLGGRLQLTLDRELHAGEFSAGPKDKSFALHLQHGVGQVTLLTHAKPLRNHWIGDLDHARWLSALVGENGGKEVLIVAATSGNFFGLLWQHGWMALIALAVCIVFWLWWQMPRFGPLAEVELESTRRFASHVGALGEFFWRMRMGALLVNAARDSIWERLRERHRSFDDGTRQISDLMAEQIAHRTGLPVKRVAAAFDVAPPTSAHNFVTLMRDLQAIRRVL